MVVASIARVSITKEVVSKKTQFELIKRGLGTFPMLEIDSSTVICDSHAIAAYIARKGDKNLLGDNIFQEAEVSHWLDYLRNEMMPLVKTLQWYTFGHQVCD